MKYYDAEALPPCEFSAHCLRLLDDLDAPADESAFRQGLVTDMRDMQDEHLIEKLRTHISNCPACSTKVAEARLQRSQQRLALRRYLADAESRVPSTTERILSMARQTSSEEIDQPSTLQQRQRYMLPEVFIPLARPGSNDVSGGNGHFANATDNQEMGQQYSSVHHTGHWLRNGFALATAAALIFAALGVFNHFVSHNGTTPLHEEVKSWPSVVISVTLISSLTTISKLYNVDTTSGASEQMTPTDQPAQAMEYETVSPDGKDVLSRYSAQGQTIYTIRPLGKSGGSIVRIVNSDVSNAIWMDNDRILIAYVHGGVEEFDIRTDSVVGQFASLFNVRLLFYHAPYLYFQNAQQTAIYRSNLATGDQEQLIADAGGLYFTRCVLSPDSVVIYCEGRSDRFSRTGSALYRVSGDGLGVQALSRRGILLGFAPDHALLFLQAMFNNYQVVKLGETLQQDHVVMNNAVPASAIIEAGDAMLAPDGHGLVLQASNGADSSRGLWYDDLTTQTSQELFRYLPGSFGQIVGWDQIHVSGTTATPGASGPLVMAQAA